MDGGDKDNADKVGSDAADPKDFPEEKQDACWKKLLRFLFSWLGLFILLAAYTLGGAYYFHVKESRLERLQEQKISNAAKDIQDAEKYIADMMEYITFDKRGKMNNCSQFVNEPHYVKSQTFYAQVCLDQSDPDVKVSKFCRCVKSYKEQYSAEIGRNIDLFISMVTRAAVDDGYNLDPETGKVIYEPKWTFTNSLLFTMTTLTLIGYGHVSPSTDELKMTVMVYTILGLPLMMMFLANIGSVLANITTYIYSRLCCRWCRVRRRRTDLADLEGLKDGQSPLRIGKEDVPNEEYMPTKSIIVPMTIILLVMTGYVVFGAAIYMIWENWSLVDACYFTFITLTTIGFGDLVPGSGFIFTKESEMSLVGKLIFTSLYCLLGLALIAMGIDLMMEYAKTKAKWATEGNEDKYDKYIVTKHYDVMETPLDRRDGKRRFREEENEDDEKTEIQDMSDNEFEAIIE